MCVCVCVCVCGSVCRGIIAQAQMRNPGSTVAFSQILKSCLVLFTGRVSMTSRSALSN